MDYFLNAITEGTMKSFVIGKGYCIPSSSTTTSLVTFMEYTVFLARRFTGGVLFKVVSAILAAGSSCGYDYGEFLACVNAET